VNLAVRQAGALVCWVKLDFFFRIFFLKGGDCRSPFFSSCCGSFCDFVQERKQKTLLWGRLCVWKNGRSWWAGTLVEPRPWKKQRATWEEAKVYAS
jgi:hypothetical protein